MASTDDKTYVSGNGSGNDVEAAPRDTDGSFLDAGAGDEKLRGGRYDDILDGGSGVDVMFGGAGADQFRFYGNLIEGGSDTDRIFDMSFGSGDTLVLGNYGSGTFSDAAGVDGFNNGSDAIISSWQGVVNAVNASANVTALKTAPGNPNNDNMTLRIIDADGDVQDIVITGGWSQYLANGGTEGVPTA